MGKLIEKINNRREEKKAMMQYNAVLSIKDARVREEVMSSLGR